MDLVRNKMKARKVELRNSKKKGKFCWRRIKESHWNWRRLKLSPLDWWRSYDKKRWKSRSFGLVSFRSEVLRFRWKKRIPRTFIHALEAFENISHSIVPQRYNFIMPVHYYCTNEFCLAIKWDHIVIIIIGSVSLFLGRHSLMAGLRILFHFFDVLSSCHLPVYFFRHLLKRT